MIPIDKGVPIPRAKRGGPGKRPAIYPWMDMEIGDSFFAEGLTQAHLAAVGSYTERKTGWKFTTRKVPGGTRVWRIE
jgi:hypothetical protein